MALTTAAALSEVTEERDALEKPEEGEHQVVERSTSCPGRWRLINGRCFLYVPGARNWAQAERNCQSMGANLASVHRADEYHGIQRMIRDVTHGYPQPWIGGYDAAVERFWLWSDGTPFRFSYWCRGEPNNYRAQQHCIHINYRGGKCWDDRSCYGHRPSVCAKNI
ncbi:ladderlectin-like [Centropristis striata]|uniref:ladderlectin-like n=1 Tax=Centropristis striata TaxID=184440 RepID=UPI0027DECEDA|nr:ladderlectin-like [Centropristis striata]